MGGEKGKASLAALMAQLTPEEGTNATAYDGVRCYRSSAPRPRMPSLYDSVLFIVGQGAKAAYLDGRLYAYDVRHYLVLSLPLPLESEIVRASPEAPYLAMGIRLEPALVRSLLLESGQPLGDGGPITPAIDASPLSEGLHSAATRLLSVLARPEAEGGPDLVLAGLYVRELYWLVLQGPQGPALRSVGASQGPLSRVAGALRRIHADCAARFEVPQLAEEAGMSPSAFHEAFKAATALSPIQYLKQIRLHRARGLMVMDGLGVSEAAYAVGYSSASQFSREFKRQFARPPSQEIAQAAAITTHRSSR